MKKIWSFALVVGILLFGFIINVIFSSQGGPRPGKPVTDKGISYRTHTVSLDDFDNSISATGRVEALNKVEIYAEVSGLLEQSSSEFKAGNYFKRGEVIIGIDDEVYKNNLFSQKSSLLNQLTLLLPDLSFDFPESTKKWEDYLSNFNFYEPLKPLPETTNSQEKYYLAAKNIYNLYYNIKSMEATWDKYSIEAPFNGIVTESNINPGTLVRNGQKLGEFIGTDIYEIAAAVSPAEAQFLKIGSDVKLISQNDDSEFMGKINRINKAIDKNSQMINVYVRSSDKKIKDGMFVKVVFSGEMISKAAKIPRSAINDKNEVLVKNGNNVFTAEVDLVSNNGNSVFVRGLNDGTVILAEFSSYSSNGSTQKSVSMN